MVCFFFRSKGEKKKVRRKTLLLFSEIKINYRVNCDHYNTTVVKVLETTAYERKST